MIKLGEEVKITKYGNTERMWLVKDLELKKYTDACYVALGVSKNFRGWYPIFNGTLKQVRKFIEERR